jgi:hypothetical protein
MHGQALAGTGGHGPACAAGKRALPVFWFFKIFKHPNLKSEMVTFLMSKFLQIL